jgi:hypothetical protein
MRSTICLLPILTTLLFATACDSGGDSPSEPDTMAVFRVDSCPGQAGETFRVLMTDPALIAEAERLIATGDQRILIGSLAAGDGGFNAPWSWHMVASTLEFADVTIELCSGCASFVENDLDEWINNVGSFCPWEALFLEREQ